MRRRLSVELDLPDEVVAALAGEDVAGKLREILVMELLREHRISQGRAAEILGVRRDNLFQLMTKYQISVIDLSGEELRAELEQPFPPG